RRSGAVVSLRRVWVLRRSVWARCALLGLFMAAAGGRLTIAPSTTGEVTHSLLVGAGASALGVLAISSDASRMWVQPLRMTSHEEQEDGADEVDREEDGADEVDREGDGADEVDLEGADTVEAHRIQVERAEGPAGPRGQVGQHRWCR